jgi:spectrin beta
MNFQAQIEAQFSELQLLASQRSSRLDESLKLSWFMREADEVAEWMGDQRAVATSEDYALDVEHVELLIQTFDSFLSILDASGGCITSCISMGHALIAEENPECERIQAKLDETQQLWEDLRELAHSRQEVNQSSASRIQICGEVYEHFVLSVCLSCDMGCLFYRIG